VSSAIEVLKKDISSYEELKKSGKKCLTTNNEECCFVHYPEIKKALLALEQKDRMERFDNWLLVQRHNSNLVAEMSDFQRGKVKAFEEARRQFKKELVGEGVVDE